ncbi:DUF397 domain-containing protein [Actinomadura rubrisoli]|uniref:DUF397 domain-containing protein n=1 Tax=Actinomadura rubrisoli TaxID=2530368 RepID=A0A4R5B413_9ACTN|nr:DUF397 domain-containing protein [Actinomadura rubrisoli]TDD79280.1 DUF397 domain-containing protein [Actinomadura rubrisoli]
MRNVRSAVRWRKSSYSQGGGATDCVEVARLARCVGVRDSKDPSAPHLTLDRGELAVLLGRIKGGELNME